MKLFVQYVIEEAALGWLAGLGYTVLSGPTSAPGMGKRKAGRHG